MLTNSEGPHRSLLGVNLVDVGNPPGQVIHRHFIAVLVLELSSLLPCPGNLGVGIGCSPPQTNMQTKISFPELNPFKFKGSRERTNNAGHHTPDVLGDLEEVRDGGGIKQLVLEERKRKKEKNQGSGQEGLGTKRGPYRDFLLDDDDRRVCPTHTNGGQTTGVDCFECVL